MLVWQIGSRVRAHNRQVTSVLQSLKEKHRVSKEKEKDHRRHEARVLEGLVTHLRHIRLIRGECGWWRLWGAAAGQKRAKKQRRLGAPAPSASLTARRQQAFSRLTQITSGQHPAASNSAYGQPSPSVRYLSTRSRVCALRMAARTVSPPGTASRRAIAQWALQTLKEKEQLKGREADRTARQRLGCHIILRVFRQDKYIQGIVAVERWSAGCRASLMLLAAEDELRKREEDVVLELKRWAAQLSGRTVEAWSRSTLMTTFRSWIAHVHHCKRERETARIMQALTQERRNLEAAAAKRRVKSGSGWDAEPVGYERVASPSGLKSMIASPGKRRLAVAVALRGWELQRLQRSEVIGAVWAWRKSMEIERMTQGYKSQIRYLREEVNDAWIEAEKGIEEMRLEAEKERQRVLDLHARTYKELQVAKHDLHVAKEAVTAAEAKLVSVSSAPPSDQGLNAVIDAMQSNSEAEAHRLTSLLTTAQDEAKEARALLQKAVDAESVARESQMEAEKELETLRMASEASLRAVEAEARESQKESDKEVKKALLGRIRAEERLQEALEAHRATEKARAEGTAAEAVDAARGMAVVRIELEAASAELDAANMKLDEARAAQAAAEEVSRKDRETLMEVECMLAEARSRAERSEKEAGLLTLSSEAALEQGSWIAKKGALQTLNNIVRSALRMQLSCVLQLWCSQMIEAKMRGGFEALLEEERRQGEEKLEKERKEAARRVREARERATQPIRELEIMLSRQEEKIEMGRSREAFWKLLIGRVEQTRGLHRTLASWRLHMQSERAHELEGREVRQVAVRQALDHMARSRYLRRLLEKGFMGWCGATQEARKHRAMEEAMSDLSSIVSRLTGVDFKKQVGLWEVPKESPLAKTTSIAPPYQSPIGKVFNRLFEGPGVVEPATPAGGQVFEEGLTPASRAACSAVLGWNRSRKLSRVPFDSAP